MFLYRFEGNNVSFIFHTRGIKGSIHFIMKKKRRRKDILQDLKIYENWKKFIFNNSKKTITSTTGRGEEEKNYALKIRKIVIKVSNETVKSWGRKVKRFKFADSRKERREIITIVRKESRKMFFCKLSRYLWIFTFAYLTGRNQWHRFLNDP